MFSPDLYANENLMAWVLDTISGHLRFTSNPAVTGKPAAMAGSVGSHDAVAQGLRVILKLATSHLGMARRGLAVNIQGAGTVGGNLARLLHGDGQRITGISDVGSALYCEDGLDIPALLEWREQHGSLEGAPGKYDRLDGAAFVISRCDVFVPCAIPNAVHSGNAVQLNCKLVVEGAHGPVSARADRILEQREIPVVPDILANGGAVVLSYFEWVQGRTGLAWIEEVIAGRLSRFMREAWDAVREVQDRHTCTLRQAAHLLAVKRVADADESRGIYA